MKEQSIVKVAVVSAQPRTGRRTQVRVLSALAGYGVFVSVVYAISKDTASALVSVSVALSATTTVLKALRPDWFEFNDSDDNPPSAPA